MRERYAIADYLTDEQKQRALAHQYDAPADPEYPHAYARDTAGYCPLGRALFEAELGYRTPNERDVAVRLDQGTGLGTTPEQRCRAARDFIRDWDGGAIEDLAAALGVEP